jgi:hypothetical protein
VKHVSADAQKIPTSLKQIQSIYKHIKGNLKGFTQFQTQLFDAHPKDITKANWGNHHYELDTEIIWQTLNRDQIIARYIEKQRIRDYDELYYQISMLGKN